MPVGREVAHAAHRGLGIEDQRRPATAVQCTAWHFMHAPTEPAAFDSPNSSIVDYSVHSGRSEFETGWKG